MRPNSPIKPGPPLADMLSGVRGERLLPGVVPMVPGVCRLLSLCRRW